jgi:hypothetical protein
MHHPPKFLLIVKTCRKQFECLPHQNGFIVRNQYWLSKVIAIVLVSNWYAFLSFIYIINYFVMPSDLTDLSQSSFKSLLQRRELHFHHMPFFFFVKVDRPKARINGYKGLLRFVNDYECLYQILNE